MSVKSSFGSLAIYLLNQDDFPTKYKPGKYFLGILEILSA